MTDIKSALADIVGVDGLLDGADDLLSYGRDWTRFYEPNASLVVFPKSIEQVQAIVKCANDLSVGLVPSGGRTGLSGGAVALHGEVVVSFDKMNQILDFDATDQSITLQPGVVTQVLQEYAADKDLLYPVDFASSGSSQIGGNISTNAGGINVLRYGMTRDWVLGLKVVTGTGELLDLNKGLVKNNTGYDLRHLFIGAEGTLGFVVEATMKLCKPPADLKVILLAVPAMTDVISVLQAFRQQVQLTAFEFFSEAALQFVLGHGEMAHPFAAPETYYVLLEYESDESADEAAMSAFEVCLTEGWASDGVLSQSGQQREDLWQYRERISESITPRVPYKNDISVKISQVPDFLAKVEDVVLAEYPDFEIIWFGHIGDGNLHLNILKPVDMAVEEFKAECEKVSEKVLGLVEDYDGSVSAEHGVGLLKRGQLHFTRSSVEIELMRSLKLAFDPRGVMNPGKVIPDPG